MQWIKEERKGMDSKTLKTYVIHPGSCLDVPKVIKAGVRDFDEALKDYLTKHVDNEELVLALASIYKLYREDGGVIVKSTHGKYIKFRHEQVVVNLIKENVEHIRHLVSYIH